MHKIFELKEMEQEQLLTLASELKIKNFKQRASLFPSRENSQKSGQRKDNLVNYI